MHFVSHLIFERNLLKYTLFTDACILLDEKDLCNVMLYRYLYDNKIREDFFISDYINCNILRQSKV